MQITDWMNRSNTPKTAAGSCNYMQKTVNGGIYTNLRCTLLQHACTLDSFLYLQGLFSGGWGGGREHVSMEPGCLVQVSVCSWSGAGHGVHPG